MALLLSDEGLELFQRLFWMPIEVSRRVDDVAHNALGVDQVGDPRSDPPLLVENPPCLARATPGEVAEQRKFDSKFTRVCASSERGIDGNAQDLGAGRFELVVEFAEAAQFVGSTAGEGQHVPGNHDWLTTVLRQCVFLAVSIHEGEVGGHLADFD